MAAPAKKTVELFYDVVSPYTWIAFEVLCRYQNKWNMDLKLKPFFLGGIMNESGNRPPAMVPNKGLYMQQELPYLAKYFGVPLVRPADVAEVMFIKGTLSSQRFLTAVDMTQTSLLEEVSRQLWKRIWNRDFQDVVMNKGSLAAQRLLTAVDMTCPQFLEPLTRQLWLRVWNRDEDITQPDSFRQASKLAGMSDDQLEKCIGMIKDPAIKSRLETAGKLAGMSDDQLEKCIGMIKDPAVKNRLKQYTEEALEKHGAFGSPTIVAHVDKPVVLFGSDRFPVLAMILGEKWEGPQPGKPNSHL